MKTKILADFQIRISVPLNMEPFKSYVTCIMAVFIPFNFVALCQFYSTTSMCYSLNFTKKL